MSADDPQPDDIRSFVKDPDGVTVEITDLVLTFPELARKSLPGKAALANTISLHLHRFVQSQGIMTHFAERVDRTRQLVFETQPMTFEVVLRNCVSGDLETDFGMEPDQRLIPPLIEFFVRPANLGQKPTRVSDQHLQAFGITDLATVTLAVDMALRVNDLLTGAFFGINVKLFDLRLGFGLHFHAEDAPPVLLLTSELSPDVMTLRDLHTGDSLDYSRAFSSDGEPQLGYQEIMRRFGLDSVKTTLGLKS